MRTKKRDRLDRALKALKKIDDKVLGPYPATPREKAYYKNAELRILRERYDPSLSHGQVISRGSQPPQVSPGLPAVVRFVPGLADYRDLTDPPDPRIMRPDPGLMGITEEQWKKEVGKIWPEPIPVWELNPYVIAEMP